MRPSSIRARDIIGSTLLASVPLAILAALVDPVAEHSAWGVPAAIAGCVLGAMGWRIAQGSSHRISSRLGAALLGLAACSGPLLATAPSTVVIPALAIVGGLTGPAIAGILRRVWFPSNGPGARMAERRRSGSRSHPLAHSGGLELFGVHRWLRPVVAVHSLSGESSRSDAELIRAATIRPDDFREVYDRHVHVFRRFLRAQVGAESVDDLTAETFAVALRRCGSYTPGAASACPWLLGIAANLARGSQRSRARGLRALMRLPQPRAVEEDRLLERLERVGASGALADALARLSPLERETLVLSALGDLSYEEIAEVQAVPLGTVARRSSTCQPRPSV